MKVFYFNSETGEEVPSTHGVELDREGTIGAFAHLVRAGSFLGIYLDEKRALQIYLEQDGVTHLEILDRDSKETCSADVNAPIAEAAIEAAFSGKDIQTELQTFFLKWKRGRLTETGDTI